MTYRIEKDTMGEVKVPADKLWGAQTERSRNNFKIGAPASMPLEIVHGFAYLKKAAAYTNCELEVLTKEKRDLIALVCDEILEGKHNDQFPLVIWQTGSGTQSNMNVNEVVANRAHQIVGKVIGKAKRQYNLMMMLTNHNHQTILFRQECISQLIKKLLRLRFLVSFNYAIHYITKQ